MVQFQIPASGAPVLSPGRLLHGSTATNMGERKAVDYLGRAEASSMVDEAVFDKAPIGGQLRQRNLRANFLLDKDGDFGRH